MRRRSRSSKAFLRASWELPMSSLAWAAFSLERRVM